MRACLDWNEAKGLFEGSFPETSWFHNLKGTYDSCQVLMQKHKRPIVVYQDRGTELVGMRKMVNSYVQRYEPREKLEAVLSDAIALYDRAQEEEKKTAEKLQTPDDDGWITVTRHG